MTIYQELIKKYSADDLLGVAINVEMNIPPVPGTNQKDITADLGLLLLESGDMQEALNQFIDEAYSVSDEEAGFYEAAKEEDYDDEDEEDEGEEDNESKVASEESIYDKLRKQFSAPDLYNMSRSVLYNLPANQLTLSQMKAEEELTKLLADLPRNVAEAELEKFFEDADRAW